MDDVASAIAGLGLRPDQRVGIVMPTSAEMAVTCLGVMSCAVAAPLNPGSGRDELDFWLDHLRIGALVTDAGAGGALSDVLRGRDVPVLEVRRGSGEPIGAVQVRRSRPGGHAVQAGPDHVAIVLPTSGTVARPKVVALTHQHLYASCLNVRGAYGLGEADRCLDINHLFHAHGLIVSFAALVAGGSVAFLPPLEVTNVFTWLDALQPTWYSAVPSIHNAILGCAAAEGRTHVRSSLRFIRSSSAPLGVRTFAAIEGLFGVPVVESYGMTEAAMQITTNPLPPGQRKPGSVGPPAGPEVMVVDDQGRQTAAGVVGEVRVRGANVIQRYDDGERHESSFADGWLRTGDLGYMDDDGYLFIAGRSKELINRGGEKVFPAEIDHVLETHPEVVRAVTFPVPDPDLGEDIGAAVVLVKGSSVSDREIRTFVGARLPAFKVPRYLVVVATIPTGATGKYQRSRLAQQLNVPDARVPCSTGVPAPSAADAEPARDASGAANGAIERRLAEIWADVLSVPRIDATDDFFGLGGHSIHAMRIVSRVRAAFGIALPVVQVFEAGTIREMAPIIQSEMLRAAGSPEASRTLPPTQA